MYMMIVLVLLLALAITAEGLFNSKRASSSTLPARKELIKTIADRKGSEEVVGRLEALNPTQNPGLQKNFEPFAKGAWLVKYAPHIAALEKIFLSKLDVYYILEKGELISNVRFSTLGIKGWLNTKGRYFSRSESESGIAWEQIWFDFEKDTPSRFDQYDKHVARQLVQAVGKAGFVAAVSRFPVSYLDNDMCVFTFPLFGTKIVAEKVTSKGVDQVITASD
jgi:hypothetical protein